MKLYRLAGTRPALIAIAVATAAPLAAQETAPAPAPTQEAAPARPATQDPAATPEAAPAAAAGASTAAACELHVFPTERLQAQTTGWLAGFGLIGGLIDAASNANRNRTNQQQLGAALDSAGQARTLAGSDLPAVLQLSGYRVIPHEEPVAPREAGRRARHAQSGSTCYAELIVTRLFYQRAAMYGRSLRTSFLFRDFGAQAAPVWTYAGRGGNGLSIFPPENESMAAEADAELLSVFRANLEEYARNLAAARQRRRGS